MTPRLVGRDLELGALARFLGDQSPATCLVLSGEAGIGKTALWEAGREMAAREGFQVLSTRSSQAEAGLSFAGLADLVDGIDPGVLTRIPAPQVHALDVAMRRVAPDAAPPDPFATAAGFLSTVRELGIGGRPLIAIDDAQWLDSSSADCLLFLARRVTGRQVLFLLSGRSGERSALERALEPLGVEKLEMAGVSLGSVRRLITERLRFAPSWRVLRQLHEASNGNPLIALELGRLVRDNGPPEIGAELPVPTVAEEMFGPRVRELSPGVRRALLSVSLCAELSPADLIQVADPLAVEDAFDEGLIVAERERVRPLHPLLAAAARKASSARERRDLHLVLAGTVTDPVLRARHRALATARPDADVAAELASAAHLAAERGARFEAEELAARALRLTPQGAPEEPDRVLELAGYQMRSGNMTMAADLVGRRMNDFPPGRARVRARLILVRTGPTESAIREIEHAIADAEGHDELRALALSTKSTLLSLMLVERIPEAAELAGQSVQLAKGAGQDMDGTAALAWAHVMRGITVDAPSEPVAPPLDRDLLTASVDRVIGVQHAFRGELVLARQIVGRLADLALERTEFMSRAAMLTQLCEFGLRAGDIHESSRILEEQEAWNPLPENFAYAARLKAVMAAVRGRPDEVREWVDVVLNEVNASVTPAWDRLEAVRAAGIAKLFESDHDAAAEHLNTVWQHCRREGVDDPGAFPVAGDLVEALVESGDIDQAREISSTLAELSRAQQHPWGLITSDRAAATIGLAGRDIEPARDQLLAAAAGFDRLGLYFEEARCLLHLGRRQRRSKQRGGARQALQTAAEIFDRLGCDGWADVARSELSRTAGRPSGDDSDLTPSEMRVVELASQGLTNKQIAKELFVSVHTVEVHLSHAYAKLGISSRSQLSGRRDRAAGGALPARPGELDRSVGVDPTT